METDLRRPRCQLRVAAVCLLVGLFAGSGWGQIRGPQLGYVFDKSEGIRSSFIEGYCSRQSVKAGERLDIVAGIIKQVVGVHLFAHKMRRDQGKVAGAEPPQQIVERPVAAVRGACGSHSHVGIPLPLTATIIDRI